MELQYLASYDYTNAKTYIMDDGDYYLAIGDSAHDALNNILAKQGKSTTDGMDENGDDTKVYTWHQDNFDSETYAVSKAGVEITNQLDNADLNYYLPGTVTYLSRSDWEGTWPKTYTGMLLSAVAVAIEIVHLVLTILMGEKRWLDILHIVPPVLLGYTMVGFLSARVASAGLILGSSLEAGNVTAHNALYQAFLGIGLYLAAIILSIVRSFMTQVKETGEAK